MSDSGGESAESIVVEIWDGYDYESDPDCVEIEPGDVHVLDSDPHHHGRYGFRVSGETRPATLNIYTNDSVREPPLDRPSPQWDGPVERGLQYSDDAEDRPFGVELWGRVLLHVEAGETR